MRHIYLLRFATKLSCFGAKGKKSILRLFSPHLNRSLRFGQKKNQNKIPVNLTIPSSHHAPLLGDEFDCNSFLLFPQNEVDGVL